jgi:hypothetical protein
MREAGRKCFACFACCLSSTNPRTASSSVVSPLRHSRRLATAQHVHCCAYARVAVATGPHIACRAVGATATASPVARSKAVLWAGHTMHLLDTWPCRVRSINSVSNTAASHTRQLRSQEHLGSAACRLPSQASGLTTQLSLLVGQTAAVATDSCCWCLRAVTNSSYLEHSGLACTRVAEEAEWKSSAT